MKLRQEQIVFAVVLVLLAALFATGGTKAKATAQKRGTDKELVRHTAPTPLPDAPVERHEQELFSPPRDSRPLPPLSFEEPPLPALLAVAPPPAPGVESALFGELLRTPPLRMDTAGLFEDEDEVEGAGDDEDDRFGDIEIGDGVDPNALEPQERRELETLYRRLYDTVVLEDLGLLYGRITNTDPYGLKDEARVQEPIEFGEVDPASGKARFPGQPPIAFQRTRVREFALAATLENQLRQAFHDSPQIATPTTWREMIELAERCIEERLAFEDTLVFAAELYRRVAAFRPEDPAPILGLARVHEAAFDFESAFTEAELAVERFGFRPEPHVVLANLERTFLMFDRAEARLRQAVAVESGTFVASAALGDFLVSRGRFAEAVEPLARAFERLPAEAGLQRERQAIRRDYAAALLGAGRVDEAIAMYGAMLRSDASDQVALAGLVAAELVGGKLGEFSVPAWASDSTAASDGPSDLSFELLVNRGLTSARSGDLEAALKDLSVAQLTDPLRAISALRGKSWIAERAGDVERSLEFVEQALEAQPGDVWCLLQRGRLRIEEEDFAGARADLRAALETNAELVDALGLLGWLEYLEKRHADAERYFERALALEERNGNVRADLWLRRGLALLGGGSVIEARESLQRALELAPDDAVATGARAWSNYLLGEAEEAIIQLRQMDDQLRDRPDDDSRRVWARRQIERITEHLTKDVWIDEFEYSTVAQNGWARREDAGPVAQLAEGVLRLEGTFTSTGEVRYYRELASAEFVAVEADVWVSSDTNGRAGLFVSRENLQGRSSTQVLGRIALARSRDGIAQVITEQSGRNETGWVDLPTDSAPFEADRWHRVRIERAGEGNDATISVYLDGLPVVANQRFTGLGTGNNPLVFGLFVEGDTGRRADARIDDVEVTRRKRS
jgi:tetratricopeptide (TPR) repeat protein